MCTALVSSCLSCTLGVLTKVTLCLSTLQSTDSNLADGEVKDTSHEEGPPEPEPPNPFSQLTDQELEEYKKEVERKKLGLDGKYLGAGCVSGLYTAEDHDLRASWEDWDTFFHRAVISLKWQRGVTNH